MHAAAAAFFPPAERRDKIPSKNFSAPLQSRAQQWQSTLCRASTSLLPPAPRMSPHSTPPPDTRPLPAAPPASRLLRHGDEGPRHRRALAAARPPRCARRQVLPQPVRERSRGGDRRPGASPPSSTGCCAEEKAQRRSDSSAPRRAGRRDGAMKFRAAPSRRKPASRAGERASSPRRLAEGCSRAPGSSTRPGPARVYPPAGKRSPHSRRLGGSHNLGQAGGQAGGRAACLPPSLRPAGRSGAGEAARPPPRGAAASSVGRDGAAPLAAAPLASAPWRERTVPDTDRPRAGTNGRAAPHGPTRDGTGRGAPLAPAPPIAPPAPGSPRVRAPPGGAAPLLKGAAPGGGAWGREFAGDPRWLSHLPRASGKGNGHRRRGAAEVTRRHQLLPVPPGRSRWPCGAGARRRPEGRAGPCLRHRPCRPWGASPRASPAGSGDTTGGGYHGTASQHIHTRAVRLAADLLWAPTPAGRGA